MTVIGSPIPASSAVAARERVDPRGLRFSAAVTVAVLAVVLLTMPSPTATVLLVLQAVAFGAGAVLGVRRQPYGIAFRRFVRPRLAPPASLEDAAPPRFAQAVGLVCALVGVAALLTGAAPVAYAAVGLALAAAFLNAAFDFCLGCEMYLLFARLVHRTRVA
jgi:hypothetical protein